jgi:hypothetical protein
MQLRTTFNIEPCEDKITYTDPVMFIGSCFASSIGSQLGMGRMQVMVNPAGTVYNPVSVHNTIETIISGREFDKDDLHYHDGSYLSFYHYTDFSSENSDEVLRKINSKSQEASGFLKRAKYLFITFGTARVYRWKKTGLIVSNCHKIPSAQFEREMLTVNEIVDLWDTQLSDLHKLFPGLKVVFTVSPVRHWKDGAHGNQISKSVLFLAIEELLKHTSSPTYFPAYELLMDDLRDYRYYDDDMLHPSRGAINYIWEAFSGCYMDKNTLGIWNEVSKITKACSHIFKTDSGIRIKGFAEKMLEQISFIEKKVPSLELAEEKGYFLNLLKRS